MLKPTPYNQQIEACQNQLPATNRLIPTFDVESQCQILLLMVDHLKCQNKLPTTIITTICIVALTVEPEGQGYTCSLLLTISVYVSKPSLPTIVINRLGYSSTQRFPR